MVLQAAFGCCWMAVTMLIGILHIAQLCLYWSIEAYCAQLTASERHWSIILWLFDSGANERLSNSANALVR